MAESGPMPDDPWSELAAPFVDGAYASVKGAVRTHVVHQHLLTHLPAPPATILDVGGGAGHQSIPLARLGHRVTILDPSASMLDRAQHGLAREPEGVRQRVELLHGRGEDAADATSGRSFAAVLCHGVLMYVDEPRPLIRSLCARAAPGAVVSLLALNALTMAVRPALQRRWADAAAAFGARAERGVLGVETRGDTVAGLSDLLAEGGVEREAWYGVWLFSDWMDLESTPPDEVAAVAAVELQASRLDPYRRLSRVFHLVGRRSPT